MHYPRLFLIALFVFLFAGTPAFAEPAWNEAQDLIQHSLEAYERLDNYQVRFVRAYPGERKEEDIFMRFEKPFVVYMHWTAGSSRGLQILYSDRHFDDKILARPGGLLFNFIPIIPMDKDDPRVMKGEAHSIETAGIGYFVHDFAGSNWRLRR